MCYQLLTQLFLLWLNSDECTPALHKKLIFYYPLITLLFATRRENAVDPGGLLGWRSLSESIHPEGG